MNSNQDKKIGVWLDHSKAHFIDFSKGSVNLETAYSNQESQVRFTGESATGTRLGNHRSTNNEYNKHQREQGIKNEYFKMLADRLRSYDDILLFGPTTAKDELYNRLKEDKHFADKTINVRPAEQLTENQLMAEVKKFFNL